MCCGCGWATGAHMTEFSTYGTGAHVASALGCPGAAIQQKGQMYSGHWGWTWLVD